MQKLLLSLLLLFRFQNDVFRVVGTPFNFQTAMKNILKSLLGKGALVYLDEFIVMTPTFEDTLRSLRKVFKLLRNVQLPVKLQKCKFMRKEIKYLGVKITHDGIKIDSQKSEAITWLYPIRIVTSWQHF